MHQTLRAEDVGDYDDPTVEPLPLMTAYHRLDLAALGFARARETGPHGVYVRAGEELQRAAVAYSNSRDAHPDADWRTARDLAKREIAAANVTFTYDAPETER